MKVAEIVVEQIVKQAKELRQLPWDRGYLQPCINYISGRPYRGINRILLFDGTEFITMKQLIAYNTRYKTNYRYVSKCESDDVVTALRRKMHLVVFYNRTVKEITAEEYEFYKGNSYYSGRLISTNNKYYLKTFILKYYRVFNIEFCVDENGNKLPSRLGNDIKWEALNAQDVVDNYCNREGVRIKDESNSNPFYRDTEDTVYMIPKHLYDSATGYESDLFHELIHSTGVKSRLARKSFEQYRDNKTEKCIEEVIAEVGSMLLCAETGLKRTKKEVENSKTYIADWIAWIEKNPDALVLASFQADRAKDFILGVLKDVNEGIGEQ